MIDLAELNRELIGPVFPVADSAVDERRLDNLKRMSSLVEELLYDIHKVSALPRSHYGSINVASDYAKEFLINMQDYTGRFFKDKDQES